MVGLFHIPASFQKNNNMKKLIVLFFLFAFVNGYSQHPTKYGFAQAKDTLRRGVIYNGVSYRVLYVVSDAISHETVTPGKHGAMISVWIRGKDGRFTIVKNNISGTFVQATHPHYDPADIPENWVKLALINKTKK